MNIEQAANCMDALGIPVRLSIYKMLVEAGENGMAVGQIQQETGVPRSTISHHIHRLMQADLVTQERIATTLICRAQYDVMNALIDFLQEDCCIGDRAEQALEATA
jgi:DNA-binding transcriptional ArsR family regulator